LGNNLIYPLRESNIKSPIELEAIYKLINASFNPNTVIFYKDILEVTLDNRTFKSLNEFKVLANNINSKASIRILFILKCLIPYELSIRISQEQFLDLCKIFRNIKMKDFTIDLEEIDFNRFNELTELIKPSTHFRYKLIDIFKDRRKNISIRILDSYNINFTNIYSVIMYFKTFDKELTNIIRYCKIKAISGL
jgi:hypothetical protein